MAIKKVIPKTEKELLEWHNAKLKESSDKLKKRLDDEKKRIDDERKLFNDEWIKQQEEYEIHLEENRKKLLDKEYNYCKTISEFKDTYKTVKNENGLKDILYFLTEAIHKYIDLYEYYDFYGILNDDHLKCPEIEEIKIFIRSELDVNGLKELEYQTPKTIPYKAKYLLMKEYGMFDSIKYKELENGKRAVLLCTILGLTSIDAVRQDLSATLEFDTFTNKKILSEIQSEIDNYKQPKVSKKKK